MRLYLLAQLIFIIKGSLDHHADISYVDQEGKQRYLFVEFYIKSQSLRTGVKIVMPIYKLDIQNCWILGRENMGDSFALFIESNCSLSNLVVQA